MNVTDTICAVATPPGRGGVSIVRISGKQAIPIATACLGELPPPRSIKSCEFKNAEGQCIDQGIVLYFKGPHSFTGEDVIEFQGHGSPIVMDAILKTLIEQGARLAGPGEFSQRAFLNDKIDLVQAEAIADLIDSATQQAARSAMQSLSGLFSKKIHDLVATLIQARVYVEAAIDFPEEEIDFLSDPDVIAHVERCLTQIQTLHAEAKQGALLREGVTLVIAGRPNAGKSTLLNLLSGRDAAIVTDIPGTTRDLMKEYIQIDGIPLHIIDTAGIRETDDIVEKEGVRRAIDAITNADRVLLLIDKNDWENLPTLISEFQLWCPNAPPITILCNKIDIIQAEPLVSVYENYPVIHLSAKTGAGLSLLKQHIKETIGYKEGQEGVFLARRRHLDAILRAEAAIVRGKHQLITYHAGELLAEELRIAQQALSEITGEFSSDDLLGEIFSSFCIGK